MTFILKFRFTNTLRSGICLVLKPKELQFHRKIYELVRHILGNNLSFLKKIETWEYLEFCYNFEFIKYFLEIY